MRISWLSNAPWGSTGYANQTKVFTPRLQAMLGHSLSIQAFWGLDGGILGAGDGHGGTIPVYSKGFHAYGQDTVGAHSVHFGADITISLMDIWVCEPSLYGERVRFCPWFPIDMEPIPPPVLTKAQVAFRPITMSRFGLRMAQAADLDAAYVPHGCDMEIFKPGDKRAARERSRLPTDRFIVGMVAANKGVPSRKAFPQQLEGFALFRNRHPDALLYLHTSAGAHGEHGGVNLVELAEHLGIADALIFADQYDLLMGYPEPRLVDLYRSFDVLMNVSMGEGFGIPILEAQACGTPVIVGDWTSMAELCWGGWKVAKSDAQRAWTPLGAWQWSPNPAAIAECLETAYAADLLAKGLSARRGAAPYDADRVTREHWRPVLDAIAARIEEAVPSSLAEADAV